MSGSVTKVLIANRGEIACRVQRTCAAMKIPTVSVYSDPDTFAQHTLNASDSSIHIGPAASSESYLRVDKILAAIKKSGADAVHPGYGFLSENAGFARSCEEAGVTFIGPPASAIDAMGDKIMSKQIAIDAGINTIPGYQGVIKDAEEAVKISNEVGYPVMIKASAGGGGKGMRIAYTDEEAREGFALSTNEAINSFGDDRIFVEKFIERPHHIEIQLLADGEHGNVVCFPERECSVQRRNQKVVEESPSVLLTVETRKEMARQSIQLAKAVNYKSAGTIEFLCDEEQNFYFLEMNTRLQVEHPVSEEVTGVDLVKHMLEVAAGKPLPKELVDAANNSPEGVLPYKGWAIESRVYAEDPFRGFLPSTGPLTAYKEPTQENITSECSHVRVDSGVVEGSDISMFYDPMISKLITYSSKGRTEAVMAMREALDNYVIKGVGHNVPFVRDVCRNDNFMKGDTPTSFIEDHYPEGFQGVVLDASEKRTLASAAAQISAFRGGLIGNKQQKESNNKSCVVVLGGKFGDAFKISSDGCEVNGETVDIGTMSYDPKSFIADFSNASRKNDAVQVLGETVDGSLTLQYRGSVVECIIRSEEEFNLFEHMIPPPVIDMGDFIQTPMPGKLISYAVAEGDTVEVGQEVCVVEAMKMQNILRSERKGVVAKLYHAEGVNLAVDEILIALEPEE